MKTAIVTGVAGFIGSNLAERLLDEKIKVIGIDCFTDYYPKEIKIKNISSCVKNKNFTLIEEDLTKIDLSSIIRKSHFLFHEAAQPGVRASWGEQFEVYIKDNILATQKILEFAKNGANLEKIVFASSSSVYGNQEGKMKEENTLTRPMSPYGTTKLATENLGYLYAKNFDLPITSLRYFTVYGPRQRPDMAFSKFIKSNLLGKEIKVFGDGKQIRDFTFVSDIIDANIRTMESEVHGNVLNIGGGSIHTINEVLESIEQITGKQNIINYEESQKGDVLRTDADISNAIKILNYNPKISLKEGLIKQISWIKKESRN